MFLYNSTNYIYKIIIKRLIVKKDIYVKSSLCVLILINIKNICAIIHTHIFNKNLNFYLEIYESVFHISYFE